MLFGMLLAVATLIGEAQLLHVQKQALVDYIGSSLSLKVGALNNFDRDPENFVPMLLILNNTGQIDIPNGDWKIYFSNLYGAKLEELDCGLRIDHVNGDLFYLTPLSKFSNLQSGRTITCTWHQRHWNTAISDFFPNWFVSAEGVSPRIISSTNETFSFVLPYDSEQKWKRSREDKYNPFTPQERYERHRFKAARSTTGRQQATIVPTPFRVTLPENKGEIRFSMSDGWVVVNSVDFPKEAKYLADMTSLHTVNTAPSNKIVQFIRDGLRISQDEAYHVNVSYGRIIITAKESAGAFYGVQSLLSLSNAKARKIPILDIKDKPRFPYRGLMIDVARNYKPKEWLFELLDVMAMYKLNRLHLHLSDDGAWRLQMPSIPELTEAKYLMGSNRCLRRDHNHCIIPQRGSGPDNTTSGSGFYTVTDYRDILRHAKNRHIVVIPEFDMPGHSRAAVASMEYRDSKIKNSSNLTSYTLSDDLIGANVRSIQHWKGNVINPCLNTTYRFVDKVLDELIAMHKGIEDLKAFHIGGDEVVEGSLDESPACRNLSGNTKTKELKRHFVKRVAEIVANKNLDVAAWEDGVYADDKPNSVSDFMSKNVYTYVWYNNWGMGRGNRSAQFADAGYKVILAMATHLYLDHSQEPDPRETGLYWASRYIDTEKTFGFMPDDIFANADVTRMGDPVDLKELCKNNWCPKTKKPENIKGIQGCMFSDQIRSKQQMHHALFPRLIAIAERAWHKAPWESVEDKGLRERDRRADWERMVNILGYQELPRLEKLQIEYRIPPPGAIIEGNALKVNTLFPNHDVKMSTDGGKVWTDISNNNHNLSNRRLKVHLKAVSPVTRRSSRIITLVTSENSSHKDHMTVKSTSSHKDHTTVNSISAAASSFILAAPLMSWILEMAWFCYLFVSIEV